MTEFDLSQVQYKPWEKQGSVWVLGDPERRHTVFVFLNPIPGMAIEGTGLPLNKEVYLPAAANQELIRHGVLLPTVNGPLRVHSHHTVRDKENDLLERILYLDMLIGGEPIAATWHWYFQHHKGICMPRIGMPTELKHSDFEELWDTYERVLVERERSRE